jgi:hypothetical protein
MSEPVPEPEPPAPVPASPQPGFFTRLKDDVLPHAEHAEADIATGIGDVASALEDHAGTILDITAEAVAVLKLADPADAVLFSAIAALVPKVLDMAVKAKTIAGTVRARQGNRP